MGGGGGGGGGRRYVCSVWNTLHVTYPHVASPVNLFLQIPADHECSEQSTKTTVLEIHTQSMRIYMCTCKYRIRSLQDECGKEVEQKPQVCLVKSDL